MSFLAKEVIRETGKAIHGYRQIEQCDRIPGRFPGVRTGHPFASVDSRERKAIRHPYDPGGRVGLTKHSISYRKWVTISMSILPAHAELERSSTKTTPYFWVYGTQLASGRSLFSRRRKDYAQRVKEGAGWGRMNKQRARPHKMGMMFAWQNREHRHHKTGQFWEAGVVELKCTFHRKEE